MPWGGSFVCSTLFIQRGDLDRSSPDRSSSGFGRNRRPPHCSFDLLVFLLLILLFICSIGLVRRGGKIEMEKVANKKKCFFCSLTRSLSLSSLRIFSLLAHFLVHYLGRLAGSISRVALLSSFLIVELFFFFSKDTLSHTHTLDPHFQRCTHAEKNKIIKLFFLFQFFRTQKKIVSKTTPEETKKHSLQREKKGGIKPMKLTVT